jgi:dynein heavy chain
MQDFTAVLPMIEELANVALKDRHWEAIFSLIEVQPDGSVNSYNPDEPFTLDWLLRQKLAGGQLLSNNIEEVARISTNASKEHSLEKALEKMVEDWDGVEFRCIGYKVGRCNLNPVLTHSLKAPGFNP